MRTLIAATAAALLLSTAAFAADPQVAARTDGTTEAKAERLTAADAKKVAKAYLDEKNLRGRMIKGVTEKDGTFRVELRSAQGIDAGLLVIDAATGKVIGG
ncbi:MAG TPA: hypothetical protein VEB20_09985 [Azospirillaceae bacterium]|nr:hypothetical protein [Azospirillaceae bacterium]